ncbi:bacteriophage protein [Burkholderia pseudomallei]|uniref:hypothetical protein n=1 Tax=Burkholderia pseudomallei TaxID=28450 RepID=UPI000F085918|nr:hypothetical protein [Burkholderia pseudomallei]CAJ3096886.1 bacteriophage protein [Burkholderia pseudomallei]CAJ7121141.1 bacteriophage protein [Burkholderia pseudomallei]CAJ7849135.1 bacteriophage protein [Burkholderia pseudomallei]CAJ8223405.1 bacteriophage protein [Burkholderia pseudomallei]CAJ9603037.1 bacteriophage protein [Burkholderia pseudomallei]
MNEIKHTPGPWEIDTIDNEGEYGDGGPDTSTGFKSYAVYDEKGRVLFDTLNSDAAVIHEEGYDLDHYAWDEVGKRNLTLAQAAPEMAMVLELLAAEADAGTVMIPSGLRLTIDAALIKAGRKAAPTAVRHVTIAGVRDE